MIKQFSSLEKILLGLVFLAGGAILFVPILYIVLALIVVILLGYLLLSPKVCFYLIILTIPFIERIRVLPISFSINDIFILICFLAIVIDIFRKNRKINLRTNIDLWMFILLILFFASGITSESPTGILGSFKFFQAYINFYFTIYFIRTKQLTRANIIKVFFLAAVFQALLGTFQSVTGIGAIFRDNRGILGYIGIGSSMVWHGMGTIGHFNMLGNYLSTIIVFCLPICHFLIKKKWFRKTLLLILFIGLFTTYSRGSLIGVFAGYLYFFYMTVQNKVKFSAILATSGVVIYVMKNFLSNTSYINTISLRNPIWDAVIASIMSQPRYFWVGAGVNSYEVIVYPFLPQDNEMWFAHNFFLLTFQEMGLVGFIIFFSFIVSMLVNTYKNFNAKGSKMYRVLNLSASLVIFTLFFISIFDHAYSVPPFKRMLFIMLGLIYASTKKFSSSSSNVSQLRKV